MTDAGTYPHIPEGGPHIVCDRMDDGRYCAVAVIREGNQITCITLGAGKTVKAAVDDCRSKLDEAMEEFIKERIEEQFGDDVEVEIKRIYKH